MEENKVRTKTSPPIRADQSKEQALFVALGQKLRRLRKQAHMTQNALGIATGLHRTYVADVERGARNISLANIAKFANAFDLSIPDLFHGIDQRLCRTM
jgi:DNA-binding XRE family transcriptional regulator